MKFFKENQVLLIVFVAGVVLGALMLYSGKVVWGDNYSKEDLITEYYKIENLVSVSPYDIKTALETGNQDKHVVVDMRSKAEYEAGHVTGAINIPNYMPSDATGEETSAERILRSYQEVVAENPGKDIIAYCYSAACMVTRKAGTMLADNGVYIKHLNIGWYEWKYYWTMWNGEDGNKSEDFITVGTEPGAMENSNKPLSPCGEGDFSC